MGLIDSHAHLTAEPLTKNVSAVLRRAETAGVEHVITIATDMNDAASVLTLAQSDARVSAAVGIHPHEATHVTDADWHRLESIIAERRIVAIGEMGLDYHYDFSDRESQHAVFSRQLTIAASSDLPIVIHCRNAHDDCVATLSKHGFEGRAVVFHCFTGNETEARDIADRGWRVSFTGVVTFKTEIVLQRIATDYPADMLMIETDSPYLSPVPVRHIRPNEPAHVVHTARFLAALRGVSYETLVCQTEANTRSFFHIT